MKKKIALLLAAVMVVGSLPMTAFASTTNTVSNIKTVEDGDPIGVNVVLDEFKGFIASEADQTVKLTLTNAKFTDDQFKGTDKRDLTLADLADVKYYKDNTGSYGESTEADYDFAVGTYNKETYVYAKTSAKYYKSTVDISSETEGVSTVEGKLGAALVTKDTLAIVPVATINGVKYTKLADNQAMAEFTLTGADDEEVVLALDAEADGSGDASVTIESVDSIVSSQTLKIANIAGGATTATISGTTSIKETATKIKNIVITETTAGSLDKNAKIKLKLTNGFTWAKDVDGSTDVVVFPSDCGITNGEFTIDGEDESVAYIELTGESTKAATLSLQNVGVMYDEDDVEVGDECEVTISDDGATKQSLVIGTASDYGVSFSVEDKDLPTFYAGRYDDDVETLVVTIKENIENSWLTDRKTKITFPEGVEVMKVTEDDSDKITDWKYSVDENEVTISNVDKTGKAELDLKFELSVAADFTGDIEATLTGSGVGDDQTVTVGTAAFPVTVDADVNELIIDYRNTEASDIVLTEAEAGVLEKGKTVSLYIDGISFDGTPSVEVESGDMKIENVKVTDGQLQFTVKTASQKEAAVIRISDIALYMSRSLPAGEYDLVINNVKNATVADKTGAVTFSDKDAIIQNYSDDDDATGVFETDEVTALKGYVTVVTAGRDQDDSTFTTKVTVTIGADTMYAGTTPITLDVPAYISNGYTMMPVRAVTEALSGSAIVRWDDATKTVVITFGQRVISMTVGSNTMKINGVDVAMQAQCEITDSRAFIPLRDLGYALGLNDSKIAWDDATKTATLN